MAEKAPRPAPAPDAYWLSFGKFISHYASAEWQLNRLVRHYYGIQPKVANTILGQLRYDTATDHLNRLYHTGRVPENDAREIDLIKCQLGPITRLRNDLVHHQITGSVGPKFFISTRDWAYIESKIRIYLVSEDELDSASTDLFVIFIKMQLLMIPNQRANWEQTHGELLREPWRYKPLSLSSRGPKPQTNPQSRRSRRQSSPP